MAPEREPQVTDIQSRVDCWKDNNNQAFQVFVNMMFCSKQLFDIRKSVQFGVQPDSKVVSNIFLVGSAANEAIDWMQQVDDVTDVERAAFDNLRFGLWRKRNGEIGVLETVRSWIHQDPQSYINPELSSEQVKYLSESLTEQFSGERELGGLMMAKLLLFHTDEVIGDIHMDSYPNEIFGEKSRVCREKKREVIRIVKVFDKVLGMLIESLSDGGSDLQRAARSLLESEYVSEKLIEGDELNIPYKWWQYKNEQVVVDQDWMDGVRELSEETNNPVYGVLIKIFEGMVEWEQDNNKDGMEAEESTEITLPSSALQVIKDIGQKGPTQKPPQPHKRGKSNKIQEVVSGELTSLVETSKSSIVVGEGLLEELSDPVREKVKRSLELYANGLAGLKKMQGVDGLLHLKVGPNYRLMCEQDEESKQIVAVDIVHRKDLDTFINNYKNA